MIDISLYVESRYRVNRRRIKQTVLSVIKEQGIDAGCEVSIAIVGDRKMQDLNNKYRGLDKTTNVLSFPLSEGESSLLPSDILRLGDVVISYPVVIKEASEMNMYVDDRIDELVKHGLLHLLGIHH